MKVAFAGTPEFARTALEALHAAGHEVVLVLTQPDRPAGRGLKLHASAVKLAAQVIGAPVAQPRSLKLDGKYADDAQTARDALHRAKPDVMVVAAYGLILPPWVLELPRRGCLNIHASLLPRWRGAAPIQRAIEAGDAQTGITIMQMDAGLDTGHILLVESTSIASDDTAASLHDRLAQIGARLIVEALGCCVRGVLVATPQPAQGATYAAKIDKAEAIIDWTQPAATIERRVRAFDPFPGASTVLSGEQIKIWRARVVDGVGAPGEVIGAASGRFTIACADRAIEVIEAQRPGGRRVSAQQAIAVKPGQCAGSAS